MQTILLTLHALIALALVGVVLLQRSEGGALGIGGGPGGLMSARGQANFLTRLTAALATAFMVTSLILAVLASKDDGPRSLLDRNQPAAVEGSENTTESPSAVDTLPALPEAPLGN